MYYEFGQLFRQLREERNISRGVLAAKAGIAVRTLGYWEAGEKLPRIPELTAALDALNAGDAERVGLLSYLNQRRGRQEIRVVLAASASEAGDAWAEAGDLLRAMRLRRGLTQAQTATELGMSRQAVLRWEMGQIAPSEENLARLCSFLKAFPAERQALASGRLPTLNLRSEMSLDIGAQAVEQFADLVLNSSSPLMDLSALALRRHLRLLCERLAAALPLLARLEQMHSLWLSLQRRQPEAQAGLNRALRIMERSRRPEPFWDGVLNLATLLALVNARSYTGAERLTRQWLPRLPDGYLKMARLCDMAYYAEQGSRTDLAWRYLAEAETQKCSLPSERNESEAYLDLTRTHIHMMNGNTDALAQMLRSAPTTFHRQDYLLGWTQVLMKFGEREAARRTLTEMESLIAPEHLMARRQGYLPLLQSLQGADGMA